MADFPATRWPWGCKLSINRWERPSCLLCLSTPTWPPNNGSWTWTLSYLEIKNPHRLGWTHHLVWGHLSPFRTQCVFLCSSEARVSTMTHRPAPSFRYSRGHWGRGGVLLLRQERAMNSSVALYWLLGKGIGHGGQTTTPEGTLPFLLYEIKHFSIQRFTALHFSLTALIPRWR